MVLKEEELISTVGGSIGKKVGLGIFFAALGSFLVGLVDGFLRPLKCN